MIVYLGVAAAAANYHCIDAISWGFFGVLFRLSFFDFILLQTVNWHSFHCTRQQFRINEQFQEFFFFSRMVMILFITTLFLFSFIFNLNCRICRHKRKVTLVLYFMLFVKKERKKNIAVFVYFSFVSFLHNKHRHLGYVRVLNTDLFFLKWLS